MQRTITICDEFASRGSTACFNFIAPLLQPHAASCVVQSVGSVLHPVNSHDFFDRLTIDEIWCKIFTNEEIFIHELENIHIIKEMYGNHFATYTTFYEYNGFIGFKIEINDGMRFKLVEKHRHIDWKKNATSSIIYVLLQCKCDAINKSANFEKLANDIRPVLDLLHENDYAHMDLFPQNIVSCDGLFKIIDYGRMMPRSDMWFSYTWFGSAWLERDRLSIMKFVINWPSLYTVIILVLMGVGPIVAVGFCTWWLHDLMIAKKITF